VRAGDGLQQFPLDLHPAWVEEYHRPRSAPVGLLTPPPEVLVRICVHYLDPTRQMGMLGLQHVKLRTLLRIALDEEVAAKWRFDPERHTRAPPNEVREVHLGIVHEGSVDRLPGTWNYRACTGERVNVCTLPKFWPRFSRKDGRPLGC